MNRRIHSNRSAPGAFWLCVSPPPLWHSLTVMRLDLYNRFPSHGKEVMYPKQPLSPFCDISIGSHKIEFEDIVRKE